MEVWRFARGIRDNVGEERGCGSRALDVRDRRGGRQLGAVLGVSAVSSGKYTSCYYFVCCSGGGRYGNVFSPSCIINRLSSIQLKYHYRFENYKPAEE